MRTDRGRRGLSYFALCAGLIAVFVVFGVRVSYGPGVYYAIVAVQCVVLCLAAWKLGAWAIRAEPEDRRRLAAAGGLLIAPWVLFSFLAGIGPPGLQTAAENSLRYLILLLNAIAVAGGLIVLREALSEAGERFYSTLGFAAIVLATPLYLMWATVMLGAFRALEHVGTGEPPPWIRWVSDPSDILLFFGGVLTYLASAAFAMSLGRIRWIGRGAVRAFVAASVVALLCLVVRGMHFPDPTAGMPWYAIPGFVFGIPAIPWIMPVMFGVALLRRAGSETWVGGEPADSGVPLGVLPGVVGPSRRSARSPSRR